MTTTLPTEVKITPEQAKRFASLNDKQTAVQAWVKAVTEQGERRLEELAGEGRKLWQEVAADYKLDLEHVAYTIDETGTKLVPRQVRLS